ncbi:MAG: hypothetical protein U5N58_01605 [Actinomycetota bacterium]|nr:hypothetical protein [Actinomycetota bacterium]
MALLLAIQHLNRTRFDNQQAHKNELKKHLEIDAFREINKSANEFAKSLTSISSTLRWLKGKLELYKKNPNFFQFNINELNSDLLKKEVEIYKKSTNFIITIEANEISVLNFDKSRKYQYEFYNTMHTFGNFRKYILSINLKVLLSNYDKTKEFYGKCDELSEQFENIISFISDYRIELMNHFLGNIFEKKVPERDPKIKNIKY